MPKGAKTCPGCKATVGCRAHDCPCGHKFLTAIAGTEEHKAKEEPGFWPVTGNTITTPAGRAPAWKGDLGEWVERCEQQALPNYLAESALRYWLRNVVSQEEFVFLAPQLRGLVGEAA